ncbi:hypothetical protein [Spirosoma linguale]
MKTTLSQSNQRTLTYKPLIHQQTLSLDELHAFRTKFPANLDADSFTLRL